MPSFSVDNTARTPFGKNQYLRSTQDVKTKSYTFAHESMPTITIDGTETRVLQPGTVLATITSGPDAGKVGVFQAAGSGADEVQLLTEGTAITAGDFTLTFFDGTGGAVTTDPIDFDATTAEAQVIVRAAVATSTDLDFAALANDITVTGNTFQTGANEVWTITYNGSAGIDVPQVVVNQAGLTGDMAASTSVAGVVGAIDGRGNTANIVGICDTFLPWQLEHHDEAVACVYEASVVQAWCIEYNASGSPVALGNTTRDAMVALATNAILFTS